MTEGRRESGELNGLTAGTEDVACSGRQPAGRARLGAAKKFVVVDAQFHLVPKSLFERVDELPLTTPEGRDLQQKNRNPRIMAKRSNQLLRIPGPP